MKIFTFFISVGVAFSFARGIYPQILGQEEKSDPSGLQIAVTYEASEGRFGDQILGYLHAKWISYRFGIELLYKPFSYSEEFVLDEIEEKWSEEKEKGFENVISWVNDLSWSHQPLKNTLYMIPFFSDLEDDRKFHPEWSSMSIDWEDIGFRALLRSLFAPVKIRPHFPGSRDFDYLTVAVHVRRGGGKDASNAYLLWPMRFPPDCYYTECLRKLCELFPGVPIYAHIFTDDLHPEDLAQNFQKQLPDVPIEFSYRKEGNGPDVHILDDFFAMMDFDCLVRSTSNYTLIPSLIGDYKVVMTPKHGYWTSVNGFCVEYYIDEVDIKMRY